MRTFLRSVVTFVSAIATYYFVYWAGGALLQMAGLSPWVSFGVALAASLIATRYVWLHTAAVPAGLAVSVVLGAIVTGAIAFSIGFFGPIIFMPGANQGPLLGIFITGPLGVIAGALGGACYWFLRKRHAPEAAR